MNSAVKIQKDVFRHVEAELYAYPYRKKEIERLRLEILYPYDEDPDDPTVEKGRNSVRKLGDPTAKAGIRLAANARLLHLERVADAIEEVYNRSLPEVRELIQLKYWSQPQRLTTIGICEKIGISESTFRRRRRQFVSEVAEILGWI